MGALIQDVFVCQESPEYRGEPAGLRLGCALAAEDRRITPPLALPNEPGYFIWPLGEDLPRQGRRESPLDPRPCVLHRHQNIWRLSLREVCVGPQNTPLSRTNLYQLS